MTLATEILSGLEQRARALKISNRRWFKAAHVSQSTYYHWKAGETSPTMRTLDRMSRALQAFERKAHPR